MKDIVVEVFCVRSGEHKQHYQRIRLGGFFVSLFHPFSYLTVGRIAEHSVPPPMNILGHLVHE